MDLECSRHACTLQALAAQAPRWIRLPGSSRWRRTRCQHTMRQADRWTERQRERVCVHNMCVRVLIDGVHSASKPCLLRYVTRTGGMCVCVCVHYTCVWGWHHETTFVSRRAHARCPAMAIRITAQSKANLHFPMHLEWHSATREKWIVEIFFFFSCFVFIIRALQAWCSLRCNDNNINACRLMVPGMHGTMPHSPWELSRISPSLVCVTQLPPWMRLDKCSERAQDLSHIILVLVGAIIPRHCGTPQSHQSYF